MQWLPFVMVFSRKSDPRIANFCLSVIKPTSDSQNCSYLPLSLSTMEPIKTINLLSSFETFNPFGLFMTCLSGHDKTRRHPIKITMKTSSFCMKNNPWHCIVFGTRLQKIKWKFTSANNPVDVACSGSEGHYQASAAKATLESLMSVCLSVILSSGLSDIWSLIFYLQWRWGHLSI